MASLDYAYRKLVNTLGPERVARSEFERMVYSHDFASLPKIALFQWRLYADFVALAQPTEAVSGAVKLSDESTLQLAPRRGVAGGALADPSPLFFAAEGTLGIVTKAVLRLIPKPKLTRPLTYSFPELPAAGRFLKAIVDAGLTPYHAAAVDRDHFVFERALRSDTPEPVDLALVAVQGSKDEVADQEKALDALASKEGGAKLP